MKKHGHRAKRSPTYYSWAAMIARCTNPNRSDYRYYGGLGIKVCERWRSFANFLEDMGERPRGRTLDREDANGDYEPSNCRWATKKTQMNNQRRYYEGLARAYGEEA